MNFKFSPAITLALLFACGSTKSKQTDSSQLRAVFNRASSVQLISYTNTDIRPVELEDAEPTKQIPVDASRLRFGRLAVIESTIKDNLALTPSQRSAVLHLLDAKMCNPSSTGICYNPHHALIFIDANKQPYGYIEFCFECTNYDTSEGFSLNFCYEKAEQLKTMFENFGVTYFGSGEN